MEDRANRYYGPTGKDPLMAAYWAVFLEQENKDTIATPRGDEIERYLLTGEGKDRQFLTPQASLRIEQARHAVSSSQGSSQMPTETIYSYNDIGQLQTREQHTSYLRMARAICADPNVVLSDHEISMLYSLRSQTFFNFNDPTNTAYPPVWTTRNRRSSQDASKLAELLPGVMADKVDNAYKLYRYTQETPANTFGKRISRFWERLVSGPDIQVNSEMLQAAWATQDQAWKQDGTYESTANKAAHDCFVRHELAVSHKRGKAEDASRLQFRLIPSNTKAYNRLKWKITEYEVVNNTNYWPSPSGK